MKEIQNFQKNLFALRKSRKLSRKVLAQMSGVSFYTIVGIELDRVKDLKLSTAIKLTKALNVTIEDLASSDFKID